MLIDTRTLILLITGAVFALLLFMLVRKKKSEEPRARFRKASTAFLGDFLIPDGEGGEIHIENALLCSRGIIIVNIKDVAGNIFGGDTMQEWAVITGEKRFAFSNPQDGLYDRTAAVKHLLPDVPVFGYIAFTDQADFNKGFPNHVISLSKLLDELESEFAQQSSAPDAFWPSWEKLVANATVVEVDSLTTDS
ncbi:MAG: NERD domain-containing protein [Gammaproteobacteria bacterium]|nr:NERD domain-containing protein [Gammaproteobacteria bacterium]MCP4091501.1 NERD domain-containing protein [Gammaproteobacteria bacterium]MCP4275411.1 NERD domain-containing protein [Gammaproteobacteria bacterium]MCP4832299.1 NERD domain-containing protein [Gammaproteobacteria bacterium]MCP4928126.1 NERD domain-containing protein [Gammaproteobacteria bacterium]